MKIKEKDRYIRRGFITIISIFYLILLTACGTTEKTSSNTERATIEQITSSEKVRIREIIFNVMQEPEYLTTEIHKEFWGIVDKVGMSKSEIDELRDTLTGGATTYNKLFYEDALTALYTGRVFKSKMREDYEEILLSKEIISNWGIEQNEILIEKIALKEPINTAQDEIVFTKELLESTLSNIDKIADRVDLLFTPPY